MSLPFVAGNSIVFECQSGELLVGDLINTPARYRVTHRGICHLPASAIHKSATGKGRFSVDHARMFLVDALHYERIQAAICDNSADGAVTRPLCNTVRRQAKTAFGYVVVGDLFDCDFDGDGTYRMDFRCAQPGLPGSNEKGSDVRELLRRVASSMNTLVCASCFSSEIASHPDLGTSPFGRGKAKQDWCSAMAKHASDVGWTALPEKGGLGDISPLCPECRARRGI